MSHLKTVPLIGALLLSITPVGAIETLEEIEKACYATVESGLLCQGVSINKDASTRVEMLCELVKQDLIAPENAVKMWENYAGPALWNSAANEMLNEYPNCPIKPKSGVYSYD